MKQCLNLSFDGVKSDVAKIKFVEKAIKENKIDGSYIRNNNGIEIQCISTESCKKCDFEEHCYFGIRKLTEEQLVMLADKFNQIKKINESDIKFGTVVKLQTRLLKIKESKLQNLRLKYGRCLSERQMQEIQSELFENDLDTDYLIVNYEDLETVGERTFVGVISGINRPFGYYFTEYSHHPKEFRGSSNQCVHYVKKPGIDLLNAGKDFEDYSLWTIPEIIEIISPEESQKYLENQKDFYSPLVK